MPSPAASPPAARRSGPADERDFLAAVDDLVADGVADPDRLDVAAYSYGGYLACWLSPRTDRLKAAIPGYQMRDFGAGTVPGMLRE